MPSVLFVCLGNICRSPTAEAVFRKRVENAGLPITIDSAGTSGAHNGERPDPRSIRAGERRGYNFTGQTSRRVEPSDFYDFNYVLAMDSNNLTALKRLKPKDAPTEPLLFLEFAKHSAHSNVPDPYYGGPRGFDTVLDLIEDASDGLIFHLSYK